MTHALDDKLITTLAAQAGAADVQTTWFDCETPDLDSYDRIVLCMSGGKDSIAALMRLVDLGVDMTRVELWHHDVDGTDSQLFDWTFMKSYNQALAKEFNLPLYFSWVDGGLEGELLREDSLPGDHHIETPDGLIVLGRDRAKPGTRLRFPQQSASLATRWCSSVAKIDVGRRALNAQDRFLDSRTLFITGERRQESAGRAKYNQLEAHACDRRAGSLGRYVDHWRPVLNWTEEQVWDAFTRHQILAPVPYRLGWGRSSCMTCIFNSPRIWATIALYFPERALAVAEYEMEFDTTISRNRINVIDLGAQNAPLEIDDVEALGQAIQAEYTLPIRGDFTLPAGAYGTEGCGAN